MVHKEPRLPSVHLCLKAGHFIPLAQGSAGPQSCPFRARCAHQPLKQAPVPQSLFAVNKNDSTLEPGLKYIRKSTDWKMADNKRVRRFRRCFVRLWTPRRDLYQQYRSCDLQELLPGGLTSSVRNRDTVVAESVRLSVVHLLSLSWRGEG
jgi:hypothetical protein